MPPLSPRAWSELKAIEAGKQRNAASLQRILGTAEFEALFDAGHLVPAPTASGPGGGRVVRTQASFDAFSIFDYLPVDGTGRGAETIQKDLSIAGKRYDAAVSTLLRTSEVERTSGKYRSIRRATDLDTGSRRSGVQRERDLYVPFKNAIETFHDGNHRFLAASITATPSRHRRDSGQWSRPDITVVEVDEYPLLPQVDVTVHAYELKLYSAADDLVGVYEASTHQRAAHYASLVLEYPMDESIPSRVESECRRHGVGLYRTWGADLTQEIEPERKVPIPAHVNDLIGVALDEDTEDAYLRAIRRVDDGSESSSSNA